MSTCNSCEIITPTVNYSGYCDECRVLFHNHLKPTKGKHLSDDEFEHQLQAYEESRDRAVYDADVDRENQAETEDFWNNAKDYTK